jgi:hypothetical protein
MEVFHVSICRPLLLFIHLLPVLRKFLNSRICLWVTDHLQQYPWGSSYIMCACKKSRDGFSRRFNASCQDARRKLLSREHFGYLCNTFARIDAQTLQAVVIGDNEMGF